MHAWILFAHGSSDPDWARPMRAIAQHLEQQVGASAATLAFLERQPPSLEQAAARLIEDGASEITVVPMFLGVGGHLKRDLPVLIDALRDRWPGLTFRLAAPIGESKKVANAIVATIVEATGDG